MSRGCHHAAEYVYNYLDHEITWSHSVRIRVHLRRCVRCTDGYEFERHLKQMIRERGGDQPPPELLDRLRALIEEHGADESGP